VKNVLGGDAPDLNVLLTFRSMDDFNPLNIVGQVGPLTDLYKRRIALTDLLSKLDGNDALDAELRNIVENPEALAQLQKEIKSKK
jgi:type VI secretion system ImpB/VipA family protein